MGDLQQVLGLVAGLAGAQENTNSLVANLAERIGDLTRYQMGADQRLNRADLDCRAPRFQS